MLRTLELVAIAAVGTALVWKGSEPLETASQRLSADYGLQPVVQGAVVAIGSSFPELVSVILSTAPPIIGAGEFDLGVSAVVYKKAQFYSRQLSNRHSVAHGGGQ